MQFIATCKFGLERFVSDELKAIGAQDLRAEDARVFFGGGWDTLAKANLWLRCADRVFWVIGRFAAQSFDELFEGVRALAWEDVLGREASFPVKGKTAQSALHSVSDCQAIVKKAIAERLKGVYGMSWCPESGAAYTIEVGLLKDEATIAIDASGAGLGRRGYRKLNADAPLAEPLAAAIVKCTRWQGETPFWDPCCGSGTIAIEAAMIAQRIAPGLKRRFAAEDWAQMPKALWRDAREEARSAALPLPPADIAASDIDAEMLRLTRLHAQNAGVSLRVFQADARRAASELSRGQIVCNPPYGERLMQRNEARALLRDMGRAFRSLDGWRYALLSADPEFERHFGQRAPKRRKLYNSNLLCQLYQYF